MADPFIGEIKLVPYNFAPVGWAYCDGSLLAISQNQALFALLGTTYGGDGQTTFGLPDLRGRTAIHRGQSPGGSNYTIGQVGGNESITLTTQQIPSHTHAIVCQSATGTQTNPLGNYLGGSPSALGNAYDPPAKNPHAGLPLQPSGGSQPHENRQPLLALNYIIALEGIFPPQN
jgi:microcystin-dependent protein